MSVELGALTGTVILGLVQLFAATQAATAQRGFKWNMSSREGTPAPLTGVAGRLDRAFRNLLESFAFFAAAVLIVQLSGRNSELSALGARTYLIARLVYVPVYAAGIVGLRSLIWLASMAGLVLVLYAAVV